MQPEWLKKLVDSSWHALATKCLDSPAKTIEALRRQVETSNNAARDAQALLGATQEQQQQYLRMPSPSN